MTGGTNSQVPSMASPEVDLDVEYVCNGKTPFTEVSYTMSYYYPIGLRHVLPYPWSILFCWGARSFPFRCKRAREYERAVFGCEYIPPGYFHILTLLHLVGRISARFIGNTPNDIRLLR